MSYPIYIFFGLAPSFIWLLFFLRKDVHPEPKRMVLKVFLFGIVAVAIAGLAEIGISKSFFNIPPKQIEDFSFFSRLLYFFLGIAFVEEFLKYLVVRQKVLNSPEFDEPVDALLYMIITALGFAALENILVLLPPKKSLFPFEVILTRTMITSTLRFIGATFLHALCSGVLGYFLALSIYETKKRPRLIILGLIMVTFLHGLYNLSIIEVKINPTNYSLVCIPIIILIALSFFVYYSFKKLKKIASICKINE